MTDILPHEVREGLEKARKAALKKSHRLQVEADGRLFRLLRMWEDGFALDAEDAPHLRGLVDLYDGGRHLSQCLIVASSEEDGEVHFEFKRMTDASGVQPLDFERAHDEPVVLLPRF